MTSRKSGIYGDSSDALADQAQGQRSHLSMDLGVSFEMHALEAILTIVDNLHR
jgi:hypothetical protein